MAVTCNLIANEIANSTNVANNTTNVYIKLTYTSTGTSHNLNNPAGSISINGEVHNFNHNINYNTTETLYEGTHTITHNSDGTKSIDINYNFNTGISAGNITGSRNLVLSTVPRKSSVSCANGNIGSAVKININRASSNFTHTLKYSFSGLTGTIATKTTSTAIDWTIPTTFYAKIPNARSGQGTITCETYSGNTKLGESTCTFTANVNNSEPTITATIVDTNATTIALTGDENKLVKYYSNAKVTINATAKNSATIKSAEVRTIYERRTDTSTTFNNIESNVFGLSCTDSRGYTTTNQITKTMIEYVKLAITQLTITRPVSTENTLNVVVKGNYFNGTFGKVANTLTLKWRWRIKNGTWSSYTTATATKSNNTFNYSGKLGDDFDYQKEYEVEFLATDKLMNYTYARNVSIGLPIIDIGKNDIVVNGDTTITGNVNLKSGKSIKSGDVEILKNGFGTTTVLCGLMQSFMQTRKNILIIGETYKHPAYYETNEFQGTGSYSTSEIFDIYVSKVLYDNESGSNGTITLSKNAENFEDVGIYYRDDWNEQGYVRIKVSDEMIANLTSFRIVPDSNSMFARYKKVIVSGNKITSNMCGAWSSWDNKVTSDNHIYITKVVGYN